MSRSTTGLHQVPYKLARGVTLIELLIVVVIVGILAAIAYPNYRQYVQRSKRTEAMSALLQIATEQERYYLSNNNYTKELDSLGFEDNTPGTGTYEIKITSDNLADTYTATATYRPEDDEGDKCATFSIDARGNKTSTGTSSDCWTSTQ